MTLCLGGRSEGNPGIQHLCTPSAMHRELQFWATHTSPDSHHSLLSSPHTDPHRVTSTRVGGARMIHVYKAML